MNNDGDGLVDYPEDTGCDDAADISEHIDLDVDGVDDDGDSLIDYPNDPECQGTEDDNEKVCGLGFELALILPVVMALHRIRCRQSRA